MPSSRRSLAAGFSPAADLLGGLEDQVGVPGRPLFIQDQAQQGQGGAVPVVAALVGGAGTAGAVGDLQGLLHGQGVKVGPEGHLPRSPALAEGVEPASPIHHLQSGMGPEEVHQGLPCPELPAGQLRMGVKGMAQLHRQIKPFVTHDSFPFPCPGTSLFPFPRQASPFPCRRSPPPAGAPPPGSPTPGGDPPG